MVLAPIGMTHSTYEQPLPAEWRAMAATPYEGMASRRGRRAYLSGDGGCGFVDDADGSCALCDRGERSLKGEATMCCRRDDEADANAGDGEVGAGSGDRWFGYGSVLRTWRRQCRVRKQMAAYEQGGEGAVVMTNAQGGSRLADEVMRSIAATYHWPDFQPKVRAAVTVDPKTLASSWARMS